MAPVIPDLLPEPAPAVAIEASLQDNPEIQANPVPPPEPAVPEPPAGEPFYIEAPASTEEPVHFAEAPEPVPELELPAFRPLQWNEPEPEWETAPEALGESAAPPDAGEPDELPGLPASVAPIAANLDLPAFQSVEPSEDLAPSDGAPGAGLEVQADGLEPYKSESPAAAAGLETAPPHRPAAEEFHAEAVADPAAPFPEEPFEAGAEHVDALSLPQEEATDPAEPFEAPECEVAVATQEVSDAFADPGAEDAPTFAHGTVGSVPVAESETGFVATEPESAAALQDLGAAATLSPELKPHTSEMAGRVVEAMLKTISTAIYSKPSASERAAFLREVAALMQDTVSSDETAASPADDVQAVLLPPDTWPSGPPAREAGTEEEASVAEVLAERIGPSAAPLLKIAKAADDPFSGASMPPRAAEPKPVESIDADEGSGELALTLLDMMSGGTGSLPHERTLAADTLLRILPRIPVKQLLSVVERVAIMEAPPPLLVAKLIRDTRAEIVAPLLERCSHISDQDLMNAAPDGDAPKLRMIARRRILSTVLSDYLIATGEPGVLLTLIRNPGAALSHEAFYRLAERAEHHHGLLAPLTTRSDLPPPVAFELFWHVPTELRRFIFSRFLTDSETLNKILKITLATHGGEGGEFPGETKFPPREAVEAAVGQAAAFRIEEASRSFSEMGGIDKATAFRILSDSDGEPVTVLLKALGCTRARFEEALTRLRMSEAGVLRQDRNPEDLQAIFDGLSFNKARILLTYWDWFMRKAGPYAPHN